MATTANSLPAALTALMAPPRADDRVPRALAALQQRINELVTCRDLLLRMQTAGPRWRPQRKVDVVEIRRVHDTTPPDPDALAHQHRGQLLDLLEQVGEALWPDGNPGAPWDPDTTDAVAQLCMSLKPAVVVCDLCGDDCAARKAHRHQGRYIGDECCWDDRLRSSE